MVACEGTNRPVARFTSREGMLVEEAMTSAGKCRRMAAMLRVKADRECDPEARAEWQYVARGYLILSKQFERNGCKNISYASLPRIRDVDEEASRIRSWSNKSAPQSIVQREAIRQLLCAPAR